MLKTGSAVKKYISDSPKKSEFNKFDKFLSYVKPFLLAVLRLLGKAFVKTYRFVYYYSALELRRFRKIRRKNQQLIDKIEDSFEQYRRLSASRRKMRLSRVYTSFIAPIASIKNDVKMCSERIKNLSKQKLSFLIREFCNLFIIIFRPILKLIFALCSYAAPFAALLLLTLTINYFNNLTFALSVEYDGKFIGYVNSESEFDAAKETAQQRALNEVSFKPIDSPPKFTLCVINSEDVTSQDDLVDQMLVQSGNDIVSASGFYVDDVFIGATSAPNELLLILDDMLNAHRTGKDNETVSFVRKIKLTEGWFPSSSLVSTEYIQQTLYGDIDGAEYYTSKYGDSPYRIAKMFGLTLTELEAMNPGILDWLGVGEKILVSRSEPYMKVKVTRRETYEETTNYGTTNVKDSTLYYGFTKVKSSGKKGIDEVVADVVYIDGVEVSRTEISRTTVKEPVNQVIAVGTAAPYSPGTDVGSYGLIWPANSKKVNCHYGGYEGHTGIDISAGGIYGAPIYAAQAGKVVSVKRLSYGYGLHVIIDHGGGLRTLYAHCSKIDVKVGDIVSQGQKIAGMGLTGNTTGLHLHFEIILNGKAINPYNYIKGNYRK